MRKFLVILSSCVTINLSLWGQLAGIPPSGAISQGLGGISSINTRDWSVFNNPAGIANIAETSAILGYQTILDFSPFNSVSAAINLSNKSNNLSLGAFKFGDDLFSSQMISLGTARKLGILDLGVKLNLLQVNIDGFGKRTVLNFEVGGIAKISPEISIGTHIYNLTQSLISQETQEKTPTIIRLSVDYHPTEALNIYSELEKDVERPADLKFGIAYEIIEHVMLRTGVSTITNRYSFGAGVALRSFTLDYAIRQNPGIGAAHNLGLTIRISR